MSNTGKTQYKVYLLILWLILRRWRLWQWNLRQSQMSSDSPESLAHPHDLPLSTSELSVDVPGHRLCSRRQVTNDVLRLLWRVWWRWGRWWRVTLWLLILTLMRVSWRWRRWWLIILRRWQTQSLKLSLVSRRLSSWRRQYTVRDLDNYRDHLRQRRLRHPN